jgi:hypothetical protein
MLTTEFNGQEKSDAGARLRCARGVPPNIDNRTSESNVQLQDARRRHIGSRGSVALRDRPTVEVRKQYTDGTR